MHELLQPHFLDQSETFDRQFLGMTKKEFDYRACEEARRALLQKLNAGLAERDRAFLLNFNDASPDWSLFPNTGIENLSGVRWKLQNIQRLKITNPGKHRQSMES